MEYPSAYIHIYPVVVTCKLYSTLHTGRQKVCMAHHIVVPSHPAPRFFPSTRHVHVASPPPITSRRISSHRTASHRIHTTRGCGCSTCLNPAPPQCTTTTRQVRPGCATGETWLQSARVHWYTASHSQVSKKVCCPVISRSILQGYIFSTNTLPSYGHPRESNLPSACGLALIQSCTYILRIHKVYTVE